MTGRSDRREIEARIRMEATRWFVRLHEDPSDTDPRAAFRTWRDADPRHADAYARLQRLWGAAGHVPALAGGSPQSLDRRRFVRSGMAMAASAVGILGAGRLAMGPHPFADHVTATGERRSIVLPDGSRAELSTATAIATDFSGPMRRIELLSGEAHFSVAPDRSRPFTVQAAGGGVTALGTSFAVARNDDKARVTVTEHAVEVRASGARLRVGETQSVAYDDAGLGPLALADMNQLAWRSGRLAFASQPLGEVVEALNRWTRAHVLVLDDALAARPVTLMIGVEEAGEAIARLSAVVPMRMARLTPLLTIVRAA